MVELLARRLVERFGAPDLKTAAVAAEEEVAFVQSLCDAADKDTLVAVHRRYEDGEIREIVSHAAAAQRAAPVRAFSFLDVEGEEAPQPGDQVSLIDMAGRERK